MQWWLATDAVKEKPGEKQKEKKSTIGDLLDSSAARERTRWEVNKEEEHWRAELHDEKQNRKKSALSN